jgi:5-(carboxyamino)imidazole ribonucleotide mutase
MKVVIVLGSSSDRTVMKGAADALEQCGIEWEARILSAHRMPEALKVYIKEQEGQGAACFIAGAGLAAHLPGVIASHTTTPVIGVPIRAAFDGLDSLLSIVQMPKGVPVATVGVNNSYNAGLLAAEILAVHDSTVREKLEQIRRERAEALLQEPQNQEVFYE